MDSFKTQALEAIRHFDVGGELRSLEPFGPGHIHASFLAEFGPECRPPRVLLQRINRNVFTVPAVLMYTVEVVTGHIGRAQAARYPEDWQRRSLQLVRTRDGAAHHVDSSGDWWRAYIYIEDSRTFSILESAELARQLGAAFGRFLSDLGQLEEALGEPIPNFHDFSGRVREFGEAVATDVAGRRRFCQPEIERITLAAQIESELAPLLASLPRRLVHNDAKLENLLFDRNSKEALCVIDLDTVMEGVALIDFGELVRSSAADIPEDLDAQGTIEIDWVAVRELAGGFLEAAPGLRKSERESLWMGALAMTCENGLRFLTDYLQGDPYFRVHRDQHNLHRCRAQLVRFEALNKNRDRLIEAVAAADRESRSRG